MGEELIQTAFDNRLMKNRAQVDAFEAALAEYSGRMDASDLPTLLSIFDDDTVHHEVMFGLVHLIDKFPAGRWVPAFLQELPRMMPRASEWADTLMARTLNGAETNELLARELGRLPADSSALALQLLADLSRAKPKPVGVRAEAMLASLQGAST